MSVPTFSNNPDDYPDATTAVSDLGITPVLVVIGGSYAINTTHTYSDLDVWAYHLEDEPEDISIPPEVKLQVLGDRYFTQFISQSLAKARREAVTPNNDPPRRIWIRENFLAQPRIFDSIHAEDFRKELLEVPAQTVGKYYLEAGNWYSAFFESEKMNTHAVRMYLTGARLLEIGDLIIDHKVLVEWAGNPSVADARQRLQTEIDKL